MLILDVMSTNSKATDSEQSSEVEGEGVGVDVVLGVSLTETDCRRGVYQLTCSHRYCNTRRAHLRFIIHYPSFQKRNG